MMSKYKLLFVIFFLLATVTNVLAQNGNVVVGQVTDANTGETIPGVNIQIQGTDRGTVTNVDGYYEISVSSLNETLVFSFVGYQRQIIPINGRTELNVSMIVDVLMAEELVVIGYGTAPKATLSGSVSSISARDLETVPVSNLSNSLGGQLSGLVMVNTSGEPGNDNSILRIRGDHTLNNNEPLIVIDGVPNRAGGLNRLNPRDIENISILKDASAAIYGAQAANGVILITTKRGVVGPPKVRLDLNQGFNQPTRLPEMADAPTYMRMRNEINFYRDLPPHIQSRKFRAE